MRMLLMIGNNNMSLRELYTTMLDNHRAGWITSFMSGMPGDPESIVSGYDAVIYELGAADKEDRMAVARKLRATGIAVITHVEGRQSAQRAAELAAAGVFVVPNPVTGAHIDDTLDALAAQIRKTKEGGPRMGLRTFFRRWLQGS